MASIAKGLINRGVSFLYSVRNGTKRVDSHTCCPTVYSGAGAHRRSVSALFRSLVRSSVARNARQSGDTCGDGLAQKGQRAHLQ